MSSGIFPSVAFQDTSQKSASYKHALNMIKEEKLKRLKRKNYQVMEIAK